MHTEGISYNALPAKVYMRYESDKSLDNLIENPILHPATRNLT